MTTTIQAWLCPICESQTSASIVADIVWASPIPGPKSYLAVRCSRCSVMAAEPMPSSEVLDEYYSNYHQTQTHELEYRTTELPRLHDPIIDELLKHIKNRSGPSFFDYGFGAGAFLIRLAERGFPAIGADFGSQNVDQIHRLSSSRGLAIRVYEIGDLGMEDVGRESIDCLTMFQVIEHLPNPLQALRRLRHLLKPYGIVYIEVPHQEGLFFHVKNLIRPVINRRNMWGPLSPPQHVLGFNRDSLRTLIDRAGFELIELRDFPVADGVHAPETAYWYPTVHTWLKKKEYRTPYGTSKMLIRLADSLAFRFLGAGGGLFAIARRRD